jgi:hypothetical protein
MSRSTAGLVGILIVGLLARGAALIVFSDDLSTDPDGYVAHARKIADGEGFVGPFTGQPTAFRPPAMPLIMAAMLSSGLTATTSTIIVQLSFGLLTIWLTWCLGRRVGLPDRFAMIAAGCVAVDPLLLRYTALPMTEVPSACLATAAAIVWLRAFRNPSRSSQPRETQAGIGIVPAATCGLVLGLFSLLRPIGIVVVAFLTASELLKLYRLDSWRRGVILRTALPAVVFGLTLLPWVTRNFVQFHQFIPATTHGGYTLALGNNPSFYQNVVRGGAVSWDGASLRAWQQRMLHAARGAGIPANDEPANDTWMYQQARSAISNAPGTFLRACVLRLQRFWAVRAVDVTSGPVQHPNRETDPLSVGTIQPTGKLRGIAATMTSVWYILLWVGLVLCMLTARQTHRIQNLTPLWLTVAAFLIIHSVYWTDARMRSPVMPILCILSITGWCRILESRRATEDPLPSRSNKPGHSE